MEVKSKRDKHLFDKSISNLYKVKQRSTKIWQQHRRPNAMNSTNGNGDGSTDEDEDSQTDTDGKDQDSDQDSDAE